MDSQMEHLEKLNPNMVSAFTDVEMPIQRILFVMEIIGFPVEKQKILEVRAELADALKNLETQIYNRHGRSFDIKSSKEVAKVVGLVRNGRISTSNKVLARLNHPVGNLIMKHRTVETSLKNTIQPLILQIVNSRIHPRSSCFTLTGRISMHEPNLQNVTKDFEINSDSKRQKISCRRVFQVRPENELISADFCQLELRILTHYSNDQSLTKIMRSNDDIFKMISAKWNNINESDVTEKQRNYSKKICYGIIYGMGVKSLAESMECDEAEAQRQQALFHKCYPGIRAFAHSLITRARECGFVETICGRRRYLPHLTHKDSSIRAEAERQALSTTIQGSGADIAKCAMLEMDKRARTLKNVHLVLHVHDELVYEAPKSITKEVVRTLKSSMENCMLLNVPLQVKLKTGRSWGTMSVTHF